MQSIEAKTKATLACNDHRRTESLGTKRESPSSSLAVRDRIEVKLQQMSCQAENPLTMHFKR